MIVVWGFAKNHIWGTMVGKGVVNERNRDFMIIRTIDALQFYVLPNRTCSTIALWKGLSEKYNII